MSYLIRTLLSIYLLGILLLYPILVIGQEEEQEPEEEVLPVVIRNVTLIDGNGGEPRSNVSILMAEDSIIGIVDNERDIPIESKIYDYSGHYVIPGLIDAHVHVTSNPSEEPRIYSASSLKHALYGGITTVRDLASDARSLASFARDALLDEIESPDIYYSSFIAHPDFFEADKRTLQPSRGAVLGKTSHFLAIDENDDLKEAIAYARGSGATGIKIYAGYDREMMRKLTEEAHRQGMKVWAHTALIPAKPSDVVAASPDSMIHIEMFIYELFDSADEVDKRRGEQSIDYSKLKVDDPAIVKVFKEMAEKNVILDPTLISEKRLEHGERWFQYNADLLRLAHKMGVPVSTGTDNLGGPNEYYLPTLFEEIESIVEFSGFTPLEAITSATLIGAKSIGIEKTHGTLEVGKKANMVILKADPSKNIHNIREIKVVIKNGKFYERALYTPIEAHSHE